MPEQSYYELLEVPRTATQDEIHKAYKRMALKWHPDRNPERREEAEEMFKRIQTANDVLCDEQKREVYDRFGEEGLQGGGGDGGPPGFPPGFPFDVFRGMFGGMNFHTQPPPKQTDIHHTVSCTLRDVYLGTKRTETFRRETNCRACDTTGYRDKQKHTCGTCKGTGRQTVIMQNGPMIQQMTRECQQCRGSGSDATGIPLCETCGGAKCNIESVRFDFEIRKGIRRGTRMVVPKMGHQNPDGSFGNLVLTIDVQEHPRFKRRDNHLITQMRISLRRALLGFRIGFEHVDGKRIIIESDSITEPGMVRRVPRMGLVDPETGAVGDLFIEMQVDFPQRFNSKQQKALDLTLHKDIPVPEESLDGIDRSRCHKAEAVEKGDVPRESAARTQDVDSDDDSMDPRNVQCAQQ